MRDAAVSISRVVTGVLWTLAGLGFTTAWCLLAEHADEGLTAMVGVSSLAVTGLAMTAQMRCYTLRIYRLLRVVGSLELEREADIRAIR